MQVVIWGSGVVGVRTFNRIGKDKVKAFIDNNPEKVGNTIDGVPIISFEQYKKDYSNLAILICVLFHDDIVEQLKNEGICQYFSLYDTVSELSSYIKGNMIPELVDYITKSYCNEECILLGMSYYTFFLYDVLVQNGCKVCIYDTGDSDIVRFVKKNYPQYIFTERINGGSKVISTVNDLELQNVPSGVNVIDEFNMLGKIPAYENAAWDKYKDIYYGKRCFIVATGPSLRMEDLEKIKSSGDYSFGMNRVYLAFENTDWRPNFYVVNDWRCIEESRDELLDMDVKLKMFADSTDVIWKDKRSEGCLKYHTHTPAASEKYTPIINNMRYGLFNGATVTFDCIQIAVYMGFKEIYLLGVDFTFNVDYKDEKNHFVKNYYNKNSKTACFDKDGQLHAYKSAKAYADKHDIKIYNATRGGALEVFERVDFDSLFE